MGLFDVIVMALLFIIWLILAALTLWPFGRRCVILSLVPEPTLRPLIYYRRNLVRLPGGRDCRSEAAVRQRGNRAGHSRRHVCSCADCDVCAVPRLQVL